LFTLPGNTGDLLIRAGARQLLSQVSHREEELLSSQLTGGETAVLVGGGAWCNQYDIAARLLPALESRYEQVIVLPSSYDVSSSVVYAAVAGSASHFFAREEASFLQIHGLCHAELACDCAFFFDFEPYRRPGAGTLNAFRQDHESAFVQPAENLDLSAEYSDLDSWLRKISEYEVVRTDRAHVMIAAAMLGKRVEYRAGRYHKVPAIAAYSLGDFDVHPIHEDTEVSGPAFVAKLQPVTVPRRAPVPTPDLSTQVTMIMLAHDGLDRTVAAVESLDDSGRGGARLLLVDNGSGEEARAGLAALARLHPWVELIRFDENLGCGPARMQAATRVGTEWILLLDNDVEAQTGMLGALFRAAMEHPDASAVTGKVVFPDGTIHLFGGTFREAGELLDFELSGFSQSVAGFDPPSGYCDWVPGCLTLLRRVTLLSHPYDEGLRTYYEDLEWCYRLRKSGASFFRTHDAVMVHHHEPKHWLPDASRTRPLPFLQAIARFRKVHSAILHTVFSVVPEFGGRRCRNTIAAAGLLLDLLDAIDSEQFSALWTSGRLNALFSIAALGDSLAGARAELASRTQEMNGLLQQNASLVDHISERQQAVEATGGSLAEQVNQVQALVESYAERQREVERLGKELAAAHEQITTLVDVVAERQATVERLANETTANDVGASPESKSDTTQASDGPQP